MRRFANREDAGRQLAQLVRASGDDPCVVLGIARGGVPVAREIASLAHVYLDVLVVRKVGVPSQPEFAMGALGEEGVLVTDDATVRGLGISEERFQLAVDRERSELTRRVRLYRQGHPYRDLEGVTAVVVDDGLATGATAECACRVVRARGATRVVMATPVASASAASRMERLVDRLLTLERVAGPFAVGQWYEDFGQISDVEVIDALENAGGTGARA
jgi:predicted phosphoribosyltransferase